MGAFNPPHPVPVSPPSLTAGSRQNPSCPAPRSSVPFPKRADVSLNPSGRRERGKEAAKPGEALTTPAPFLALSSSWKKFSSSLPSM